MVYDRTAACEIYKGKSYTSAALLGYYEYTKRCTTVHPKTKALLEELLITLKGKGEGHAFAYLRKLLKKGAHQIKERIRLKNVLDQETYQTDEDRWRRPQHYGWNVCHAVAILFCMYGF